MHDNPFYTGNDDDGFQPVIYKKRKKPVDFTKDIPTNVSKRMAGGRVVRDFSLLVGGISNDVSPKDITTYIKEELGINLI